MDNFTLLEKTISTCTRCQLFKTRNNVIFGEGSRNAPIFIIGEAPGAEEDKIGRPFIGASGKLLDKILQCCGFNREQHVFISNIVRCRPPGNRVPSQEERDACIDFLYRQIELINPRILITLGATPIKELLDDRNIKITKIRGNWLEYKNRLLMPVYHPSALLRNPNLKQDTWADFKKVVIKYRELVDADHHSDYC